MALPIAIAQYTDCSRDGSDFPGWIHQTGPRLLPSMVSTHAGDRAGPQDTHFMGEYRGMSDGPPSVVRALRRGPLRPYNRDSGVQVQRSHHQRAPAYQQ